MAEYTVYKVVVHTHGEWWGSATLSEDAGEFWRAYRVGRWTKPPAAHPNAWLFAFGEERDALLFASRHDGVAFEAVTSQRPRPVVSGAFWNDRLHLARYWSAGLFGGGDFPKGSLGCADIKLVRML